MADPQDKLVGEDKAAKLVSELEDVDLFSSPVTAKAWDQFSRTNLFTRNGSAIVAVFLFGIFAATWHLYTGFSGEYALYVVRPIHVLLIMGLGLLTYDWNGNLREFETLTWHFGVDLVLFGALAASTIHPALAPGDFRYRYAYLGITTVDHLLAVVLIVIILEMVRRVLGIAFLLFIMMGGVYTLFITDFPGPFSHAPISVQEFIEFQYMSTSGVWGAPIGVMATYVTLFIIFGSFIDVSKGGIFIQRLGNRLTGGTAGGPSKVAVVTSGMMGMITGSALANVSTTGSFTIPLMKRLGYSPEDAGGIEAAASSGGQFTPPIMGAVAFIIASVAGIPYLKVVYLALVPALLYYISLFVAAHTIAKRDNLPSIPEENLPSWREIGELAHMLIPVAILILLLVLGYSVVYSALASIVTIWAVSFLKKNTRMDFQAFSTSLYKAAQTTIIATTACAAAGLVIGMVQLTGLGVRLSSVIVGFSSGNVLFALVLVMIVTVLLGMGMPTVPAYAVTVAIGLPALSELGMNILASHMFIMYFAVLSCITPPVMVASYAAASIAGGHAFRTGYASVKFALLAFLMPFIFILNPELLLVAVEVPPLDLVVIIISAVIGAVFIGMGTGGYGLRELSRISRAGAVIGGILLLTSNLLFSGIGFVIGTGMIFSESILNNSHLSKSPP